MRLSWLTRPACSPENENSGGGAAPSGDGDPAPRKANAAVVDQVQGHEGRIANLEKGFFSKLFGDATKPKDPPPAGQQTPAAPPKKKPILEELGEVADPFGLFEDDKPAPVKPEAPAADDAAA